MLVQINQFRTRELGPGTILLSFTCIIAVRTFLEVFVRRHTLATSENFYRMVVYYLHPYLSWLCVFAAIALLMTFFLQWRYRESVLFTLLFSPLILIVPLVDTLIGGGRAGMVNYAGTSAFFVHDFLHLFNPAADITMVTSGVRLEIFLVVAGSLFFSLFVYRKGLWRSFGLAFSIYAAIFIFGYLPAIYGLTGWRPGDAETRSATGLIFPQVLLFLYILPFIVIAGLTCLVLAREKSGFRPSLLLIPVQGVFPVALAAGGFFLTAFLLSPAAGIMNFGDLCKIGAAVLSLYLLFLTRTLRKGGRIGGAAALLLTLSLVFGTAADGRFLLFWIFIAAVIFLYDEPPFELSRVLIICRLGEPLIALAALLSGAGLILPWAPWRAFAEKGIALPVFCMVIFVSILLNGLVLNRVIRENIDKEKK